MLLDVIVAVNSASIGLQVSGIYANTEIVADLFPA